MGVTKEQLDSIIMDKSDKIRRALLEEFKQKCISSDPEADSDSLFREFCFTFPVEFSKNLIYSVLSEVLDIE